MSVVVVLACVIAGAGAAGASAAKRSRIQGAIPRAVVEGTRVKVIGSVSGSAKRVALQARRGSRWTSVSSGRARRHRFTVSWAVPHRTGTLKTRLVALRGRRVLGHSRTTRVHITTLKQYPPGKATVVVQPTSVSSAPVPGQAGVLVLHGIVNVSPGKVLAFGYSPSTPDGFLGRVISVAVVGGNTVLNTVPATLEQAGAQGTLDLATFHEVAANGAVDRRPFGAVAHVASDGLGSAISQNFSCSGGASASVTGSVNFSISPALSVHFSLFSGLTSASFTVTGSASAALRAEASANGSCTLSSTPILPSGLHIATFVGFVGPIPVVVVLRGQIFVDAGISAQARVCTSIGAGVSMAAGVGYSDGHFGPIIDGPHTSFTFNPPGVSASANANANVEPAIQALLYGVGGPQVGLKAGLAFNADINKNPWWTLGAPLSLNASLTAPVLGLNSGELTLFSHTFPITDAGGPFPGYPTPPQC